MQAWKVHKFGGSSVADAACMRRVAAIVESDPAPRKAVVLSACRGITDALLNLVTAADLRSQKKVISIIRRAFPGHAILAEEAAQGPARSRGPRSGADDRDVIANDS